LKLTNNKINILTFYFLLWNIFYKKNKYIFQHEKLDLMK